MRTRALEGTMTAEDIERDRKGKAAVKEEDTVEVWEIFDDSEEDSEKEGSDGDGNQNRIRAE